MSDNNTMTANDRLTANNRLTPTEIKLAKTTELGIPEPFVAHSADTAFYFFGIGNATESRGNHIAVFKR